MSFVIIINKQVSAAERGTVSCIIGHKNNPQSITLLLVLFLHLAYLVHLLTSPYCSKEARRAVAGRGNVSFAVVVKLAATDTYSFQSALSQATLLLVLLILVIVKMVDTRQWGNNIARTAFGLI